MSYAKILVRALNGRSVSAEDAKLLLTLEGEPLNDLLAAADEIRRRRVGNYTTYVVNRNINFTNVCVKRCGFCAFSRGHRAEDSYFLDTDEIVHRTREAVAFGATEVCVQAGLAPRMEGWFYVKLCRVIKAAVPSIHVHGFSPEEVLYGATLADVSIERYLSELKDAGVGSLPGTSAEILDESVRQIISPGRISVEDWVNVIRTAHRLGIPTSSTMMFGHVESPHHIAHHLTLLRSIQRETGGFTEFVPLSFIAELAPMYRLHTIRGVRPGPSRHELFRIYAVSRLVLHNEIDHIQVSWVKQGPALACECLRCGADDFGGTLMNESISTAAGAKHGQMLSAETIRSFIRQLGRIPVERSTIYKVLRSWESEATVYA